jgi:hypothetical protein
MGAGVAHSPVGRIRIKGLYGWPYLTGQQNRLGVNVVCLSVASHRTCSIMLSFLSHRGKLDTPYF